MHSTLRSSAPLPRPAWAHASPAWQSSSRNGPEFRRPQKRLYPRARRPVVPRAADTCTSRPTEGRKLRNGSSALMRHSMAQPSSRTSSWRKPSGSPAATRIMHSTRVQPRDHLRHRVLYLQPGVHLQESRTRGRRPPQTPRSRRSRNLPPGPGPPPAHPWPAGSPRPGMATAPLPPPSGAAAEWNIRAPTGTPGCRAGRRVPESRCGAAAR